MHRRFPSTLAAQGDSEHSAATVRGRRDVVWVLKAEVLVFQQAVPAASVSMVEKTPSISSWLPIRLFPDAVFLRTKGSIGRP